MEAILKSFAQNIPNSEEICSVCGAKILRTAEFMGIKRTFRVMCKCMQKQQEEEKIRQENQERMRKIEKLKRLSLLGERYKNATFENSKTGVNPSFDRAFKRCRKYCEIYEETIKNGCGIYLFGDKGVGKNMALGVGVGFVNAMDSVKKEMQEAIPTNFDTDLNMSLDSANSVSNIKIASEVSNNGIFGKLDSILSLLEYYIPALQNRQLCLDTGVLVGELTPPINKELAKIEISRERGR